MHQRLHVVYWICLLADVVLVSSGPAWAHGIAKICLMPLLIVQVLLVQPKLPNRIWLLLALTLSGLGDAALLTESGFLFGLGFFLLAHLFYLRALLGFKPFTATGQRFGAIVLLMLTAIAGSILMRLWLALDTLAFPVVVYALALVLLVSIATASKPQNNHPAWRLLVAGACLFLLSDTLLAINKFGNPLPLAGTWVMATYGAAQWLITQGFLDRWKSIAIKPRNS